MSDDTTLERFYTAFAACDGDTMAAAYTEDATFADPVFPDLRDDEPGAMWRMLTSQATDLQVELLDHAVDGDTGSARWRATYTFSATGRKVVNVVDSRFRFRDGRIAEQVDTFDFYRWSRQALGPIGMLLGWSPIVRNKVRTQARRSLDKFTSDAG